MKPDRAGNGSGTAFLLLSVRERWAVFLILLLMFFLFAAYSRTPFFWDTIQLSGKHGWWYYEQEFRYFLLPDAIDSGHPPFWGMYQAACWQLFGPSLVVSHWSVLPFTLLSLLSALLIGDYVLGRSWRLALPILFLADPLFLTQNLMVSPDAALTAFFLLGWCAMLYRKDYWKAVAIIGLSLISTRAMMVGVGLFLIDFLVWNANDRSWKKFLKQLLPYLPGGLCGLVFLGYHYFQKGWIGYHPDSPWAPSFALVNLWGFLRNLLVLMWRFLDFGRVGVVLISLFLIWKTAWREKWLSAFFMSSEEKESAIGSTESLLIRPSIATVFILGTILSLPFLLYAGLGQHRYLLPVHLSLNVLFLVLMQNSNWKINLKRGVFTGVLILLLSGHAWIYPDKIAQGWDATLAHWPYFQGRRALIEYLDTERIPPDEVGAAFPAIGAFHYRELNDKMEGFSPKDLERQRFIFYSNVMNDFADAELDELFGKWKKVFEWKQSGVRVILFQKPV